MRRWLIAFAALALALPPQARADLKGTTLPLAGFINVKDFGAKGDGSDATVAFQAAAAAATAASGGNIFVPAGSYTITGAVTLSSNTRVYGAGAGSVITQSGTWGGGVMSGAGTSSAFNCANAASGIQIERLNFSYATGNGATHILEFTNCSHIKISNNMSNGAGDLVAIIGGSDVVEIGNTATNISNSCYDQWGGALDVRVIGNYCSTFSGAGAGLGAIQFTGINTDGSAASTIGFVAYGNQIYINNANAPQCFIINGHASSGTDKSVLVANNRCVVQGGNSSWGVLVTGKGLNGIIEGNYFEGNAGSFSAIAVQSPAANFTLSNNIAYNWQAGAAGVFQYTGTSGTVRGNRSYSGSSPTLDIAGDSTIVVYDNDADGSLSFGNPSTVTPFKLATTGHIANAATFDGAVTLAAGATNTNGSASAPAYGFWTNANGMGMYRDSADKVCFATASTAQFCIDPSGNLIAVTGGIQPKAVNFSALPTCAAGTKGLIYRALDVGTPTYGAIVNTGGAGASDTPLLCDGTNWRAH